MTAEQIKEAVENYYVLIAKRDQIQNRIVRLAGGGDPDREAMLFHRLETIERAIELIDHALFSDDILTMRENFVLYARVEGMTHSKIAETLKSSKQTVSRVLHTCYNKIADFSNEYAA